MANRSNRRRDPRENTPVTVLSEPEVRRWPHPIPQPESEDPAAEESALYYIRCALTYQNEVLSEIKTLLEQIALKGAEEDQEA